ncbi:N-acetyltransferase GCN5 [Haloferax elongans ATCC BAA-1513]|uniref:N-acetyltransferase GCN5 n=1 Tax=Haloferax elongans ATCC BAA-1513 TaxID=1230453 RepID=M0HW35_HALEO|nr:GNAT family N-acetyltransferase [Haloferax elongans]ELZ87329.1 N-acetyltransferase GCN5 [Haloferax elongans ATCC BAA-1513]
MSDIVVREGTPDELVAVVRILDAGLLEATAEEVRGKLDAGDCLVADDSGRVVGALVLEGDYVDSVAVSPSRRGRGIGTTLVRDALARRGRLVADFDERVRPFYESLGFDIDEGDDQLRGVCVASSG